MTSINNFDSTVYSEEIFSVSEADYDAVMSEAWAGYADWSEEIESQSPNPENFTVRGGLIYPVAVAAPRPRIGAIEI